MLHKDITGADAIHPCAYVTSTDPGAVGAGKLWIDTTAPSAPVYKIRNTGDTGWDDHTPAGTTVLAGLADVDLTGLANGDILYFDNGSSTWVVLGPGSSGQVLTISGGVPTWAAPSGGGGGGGGGSLPYPLFAPASPDGNNDEFDGTGATWTVATALTSPNVYDINADSNSLLLAHLHNGTGDILALTKALSGTWTGDVSVTARIQMGKFANYTNIQFGFLDSSLNAGIVVAVDGSAGTVYLFQATSFDTGSHSILQTWSSAFPTGSTVLSLHAYVHLQRISGTWEVYWSSDGIGWNLLGTDSTALTIDGAGVLLAGFGAAGKYTLGMDFLRFNWLFLP